MVLGEDPSPASDVYGLGALGWLCLTGSVPFAHSSVPSVLYAHLESPSPTVSDLGIGLPPALDEVIAWALAKSPDDRPQSATALAQAAAQALSGAPVSPDTPRARARSLGAASRRTGVSSSRPCPAPGRLHR